MECTYILDEIFPTSKRSLPREILQTSSKSKRHLNHIIFRFCLWHKIFTTFHLSHLTQGFLFFVLATNLPHSPTDVTQKSGLYEETKNGTQSYFTLVYQKNRWQSCISWNKMKMSKKGDVKERIFHLQK